MGDSISTSAISMTRSLLLVFLSFQLFTLGSTGILRNEDAQWESARRCVESRVDMSNVAAAAAIWGQCLLCNLDGSNSYKATETRNLFRDHHNENAHYIVFVSNYREGFANFVNIQSTTGYIPSDDTCGTMVLWKGNDNLITKTRCSSSERSGMTTLMRYAALGGGSNIDVRDRLSSEIKNFGYNYHYIGVARSGGSGFTSTHLHSSCFVEFRGAQHKISVYIK